MSETLNHNPEDDKRVDGFGLSKERRLETVDTNIDLILRRCIRKEKQPREMLLGAFEGRRAVNKNMEDNLANEIQSGISSLPDYDLSNEADKMQARQDMQYFFHKIIDFEFSGNEQSSALGWQDQGREDWQKVGVFSYEIGENQDLILHISPMSESLQLKQLKDSLKELATLLEQKTEIETVNGSSLLLEHPIAKRLGFELDAESDDGFNPNFHMSRKEFIEKFKK